MGWGEKARLTLVMKQSGFDEPSHTLKPYSSEVIQDAWKQAGSVEHMSLFKWT
jgi:hypothetical protein